MTTRNNGRAFRGWMVFLGSILTLAAVAVLIVGAWELTKPDYLATILLTLTGLSLLHAGVELLRPEIGE